MDKYIVRTPRSPRAERIKEATPKSMKQATIESLPKVVVVEDILRLKCQLESHTNSVEEKISALQKLSGKTPSKAVMLSTKIGHTVNSLRHHENKDLSLLAKEVFRKWKAFMNSYGYTRPMIEVRCDKKTEALREKARQLLAVTLSLRPTDLLPEQIERTVFHKFGRLVNNGYRRKMRKLIFMLKHDESARKQLCCGSIMVTDLCTLSSTDLKLKYSDVQGS